MRVLMFQKASFRPFSYYRSQASKLCGVVLLSSALLLSACDSQEIVWPEIPGLPDFNKSEEMAESTSHMKKTPVPSATKVPSAPPPPMTGTIPVAPSEKQLGYNPKNIFGKSLRSDSERLDRLERAVQDMRNEFDTVRPSIRRLMAVESDIQSLIGELQQLSRNPSAMAPAPAQMNKPMNKSMNQPQVITPQGNSAAITPVRAPKPMPAVTPKTQKTFQTKTPPPVTGGQATVYDVRVGEHTGKSRIVLDVNTTTPFNVDVDNNEKIMIVELPQANWTAVQSRNFGKSPIVSSFAVEPSGNGHILIFQLKKAANVIYQDDIGAFRGSGRRIVIDLSS